MELKNILNKEQYEAATHGEGPLLILAGAGSGKTRVLTHRIAYLILEKGVSPYQILAITFTNKAAQEMRDRVNQLLPERQGEIWVSTFHSMCLRILRREIGNLGYDSDFSIYDTDDQKTVMRQVFKELQIDSKMLKERLVLSALSQVKNQGRSVSDYLLEDPEDFLDGKIRACIRLYEEKLKQNNALDFDDLLLRCKELFEKFPAVLEKYQERFRYILVDEYQDTNDVQFHLVYLLAKKYQNICVVGDDDQSIYRFRGANVENILSFESHFPNCKVVKLEQNYRSTAPILDLANVVIAENQHRKQKKLWTAEKEGLKVSFQEYESAKEEAAAVIRGIRDAGWSYKDQAVLYRTNAQSRLLEEQCIYWNIPYQIVGGVNFYQRKEIKDILSYMKILVNKKDDVALRRIINVPKRGIGEASLLKLQQYGESLGGFSLVESLPFAKAAGLSGKALSMVGSFQDMLESWKDVELSALIDRILQDTEYEKDLQAEGAIEAESRMENIQELQGKLQSYIEENGDEASLAAFLEEVSLLSDLDRSDLTEDKITLMTLHGAKGLEFPVVYLVGLNEGLFPSSQSMFTPEEREEERRLFYVGITRAEKELYLTAGRDRVVHGQYQSMLVSSFVDDVPEEHLEKKYLYRKKPSEEDIFMEKTGRSGYSSYLQQANQSIKAYMGQSGSYGSSGQASGSYGSAGAYGTSASYGSTGAYGSSGCSSSNLYGSAGYSSSKKPLDLQAYQQAGIIQKGISGMSSGSLDYQVGDRVSHIKFGEGEVLAIEEDKKDKLVTVLFDTAGQKKMLAGFAKLKKL